jgi:hypothetical protein
VCDQCAMEAFDCGIGLGMVRSSAHVLDAQFFEHVVEQCGLKLTSLIGDYRLRYTKAGYPRGQKRGGTAFGRDVSDWHRFWPSSEFIHHRKKIGGTGRGRHRKGSDYIDMDCLKPFR